VRLLEYEAKQLLNEHTIPVPRGEVLTKNARIPFLPVVLKSQVPAGGRGKLGGIKIAANKQEANNILEELSILSIKGHIPTAILAEEKLEIASEHYLCLLVDRSNANIRLVAHKDGGMEVESNGETGFFNEPITANTLDSISLRLASYLGYPSAPLAGIVTKLYKIFVAEDATLLEINPLIYTKKSEFVCGDCKMELDDAAAFRHPEWNFKDAPQDANFVTLDKKGRVATIANGAGLAMATVDAAVASGMTPANFLDIGGGASAESILHAFQRILEFSHIDAIVINIFAGITHCDEVAKAVIAAKRQINTLPPLFIRLAGTNFEEAVALLAQEDILTLGSLEECLEKAKELVCE
jgi:succinyl-CoA synthetase beta subunit